MNALRALVLVLILPALLGAGIGAVAGAPLHTRARLAWWPVDVFGGLREITTDEAVALAASDALYVVQVAASWRDGRAIPGARFVAPDAPIAGNLLRDASETPVLVVGDDAAAALHFAARLARAGARRVAVLAADESRWRDALAGATPARPTGI